MIRLCPADYHRYHAPCAGTITACTRVRGTYHSVNPIALASGAQSLAFNKRSITLVDSDKAGCMAYVVIGAFGVGSFVNHRRQGRVEKMEELGYFRFGGSTVALLFEAGRVRFCDDLVKNSAGGMETLVRVGENLAYCNT